MIAAKRDEVEAQWEQRAEYLEANGVPARGSAIPGVSPIKIVFHSSRRRPASERRIFKILGLCGSSRGWGRRKTKKSLIADKSQGV
jgi:hypothetical protein